MPFPNSGGVNLATRSGVNEYVFAKLDALQSTNIGANDHVKWDTVLASRGGSVALDTSTTYSASQGAACIGRFTLKAALTYKLMASLPYLLGSGATGLVDLQWFDATLNAALPGTMQAVLVATTATNDMGGGQAVSVFSPAQDTLVELRIITATALTQLGTAAREAFAFVETI